jgi:D-alanyl-D-alanine dipeptidase
VSARAWICAAVIVACTAEGAHVDAPPVESKAIEPAPPAVVAPPVVVAPPERRVAPPPDGLVDLREHVPELRLSIGYATAANFTGAPLPGYEVAGAWAHADLAKALAAVDHAVAADGLGLLVFDAYRPQRATRAMVEWTRVHEREDLLKDGYISAKSQHNRGLAIDLTLVDRKTGAPIDMGGAWDTFDRSAAAFAAKGEALTNRKTLRAAMTAQRFVPHEGEWWHFSLPHPRAPALDVPYGE